MILLVDIFFPDSDIHESRGLLINEPIVPFALIAAVQMWNKLFPYPPTRFFNKVICHLSNRKGERTWYPINMDHWFNLKPIVRLETQRRKWILRKLVSPRVMYYICQKKIQCKKCLIHGISDCNSPANCSMDGCQCRPVRSISYSHH